MLTRKYLFRAICYLMAGIVSFTGREMPEDDLGHGFRRIDGHFRQDCRWP